MDEFKPCPFCGSTNIETLEQGPFPARLSWVKCRECYAMIKRKGGELQKAAAAWNRRAADHTEEGENDGDISDGAGDQGAF